MGRRGKQGSAKDEEGAKRGESLEAKERKGKPKGRGEPEGKGGIFRLEGQLWIYLLGQPKEGPSLGDLETFFL